MSNIEREIMELLKEMNMNPDFITAVMMNIHCSLTESGKKKCFNSLMQFKEKKVSQHKIMKIIENSL